MHVYVQCSICMCVGIVTMYNVAYSMHVQCSIQHVASTIYIQVEVENTFVKRTLQLFPSTFCVMVLLIVGKTLVMTRSIQFVLVSADYTWLRYRAILTILLATTYNCISLFVFSWIYSPVITSYYSYRIKLVNIIFLLLYEM